jgi:acyl-CoA dehydrogenase
MSTHVETQQPATAQARQYDLSAAAAQARQYDPIAAAHTAAKIAATYATEIDEEGRFPQESLQELKRNGLMGLIVPQAYGGMGASYTTMAQVAQILASACLSTSMIWAMHCQQVATIVDHAPEELKQDVLPRIARGEMFIASVTTEREKGGHLFSAHAALKQGNDEEEVQLMRDAPVVTGGAYADSYLITMRTDEQSQLSEVVLVYADRKQLTIETQAGWHTMGMRGTQSVAMLLQGDISRKQVINPPGGFAQIGVSTLVPVGHIAWASAWLGAVKGAFHQMVTIFHNPAARKGFNLQSELLTVRLARVRLQLDTVDAYLSQIVDEYEHLRLNQHDKQIIEVSPGFNIRINNLKLLASETLFEAIDQLVQLGGLRYGYQKNTYTTLERTFRDLRSASLMYTNDRLLLANGKLTLLDGNLLPA